MNVLLCGKSSECHIINGHIKSILSEVETFFCENCDTLLELLAKNSFDMAVVLFDGADGMETVITLKRQCSMLPIVWLSDDSGFATQSYRLSVAYFHEKPITPQILNNALASCKLI